MSNTDSIGVSAESVSARVNSPRNPLLSTVSFFHPCGYKDALSNCASTVYMLADFFGGDAESRGYEMLSTESARRGVWNLLYGVAGVLEAAAKVTPSVEAFVDIAVPFSAAEYKQLQQLAHARGCPVDALIESLIRERLNARP